MAGDWDHDNSAAKQDLDAEVARFLAAEFFACSADGDDSVAASSYQSNAPDPSLQPVTEDLLFMDLLEPLDLPDLELGGVDESPLPDSQMRCSSTLPAADDITTRDLQPLDSLRVLVPASDLATPRTSHGLKPLQKDALPHSTMKKPRKRVKDELEYLRQQVKNFEDELEKLQRGSSEEVTSETDSLSFSVHSISQSQSESWESVAKRQECEKQKAKAENTKLKEALNNQLQLARSLSRLLETQQDLSVRIYFMLGELCTVLNPVFTVTPMPHGVECSGSRPRQLDERRRSSVSRLVLRKAFLRCSQPKSR